MTKGGKDQHAQSMKGFVTILVIVEVIIVALYGVFVRFQRKQGSTNDTTNMQYYPAYQDVNVMMLIGFGYLMAFSRSFSWSAVSYTFFINAISVQLYILLYAFWKRVIITSFQKQGYYIYLNQTTFTSGLYSSASMLIALGCSIGRVGPLQVIIMCIFHQIGYALNEVICLQKIHAFDVGGSMTIHSFGAYEGLTISLILVSILKPTSKPESNYFSNLFGFIGALFLWMYWPSFNFGVFAKTAYTKNQIIGNTILSLTGSCLITFATSGCLKGKFTMEHLLNSSLAGGVIIGAAAGLINHPGGSLAIGCLGGFISTLGYHYLTPYLQKKINLYDTCGVHNLHGLPGMLGGIVSAIIAASYKYPTASDAHLLNNDDFPYYDKLVAQPYKQGGLQIAATFTSIGIGICTALICGIFLRIVYNFNAKQFFNDGVYFEQAQQFMEELKPLKHKVYQKNEKEEKKGVDLSQYLHSSDKIQP